ncbi:hypothetical protein EV360DRAFT_33014 [Lentinula raphanica]|nr:hypothetical protein EV360DRAFT_33014 [Lentinula raphanica]
MSDIHEKEFKEDIKHGVRKLMRENGNMSAAQAFIQVTKDMLKNNPFVPPTSGCPINDLPNELLAHIFYLGMEMEMEDEDLSDSEPEYENDSNEDELDLLDSWDSDDEDEGGASAFNGIGKVKGVKKGRPDAADGQCDEEESSDEEENERHLPFQVLVSHVCRHFREVAIESPLLWTTIHYHAGTSLSMAKSWLERSKGHPLQIEIDCHGPDDEEDEDDEEEESQSNSENEDATAKSKHLTKDQISELMDILIPAVNRWQIFSVQANYYESIHLILERFSKCSSAPLLEVLELYHYEDCEEFEHFSPPELSTKFTIFGGDAPKLKSVALWGVHIDWDTCLTLLSDLHDLELAYHANDVRPSFQTFSSIITGSPELETLSLCLSGPSGSASDWGDTPIDVSSVKSLTLCHHEAAYVEALLPLLHLPNVTELYLDYDSEDYSEFALLLSKPLPGRTKSILAGLDHLKLGGFPSNRRARQSMLEQLVNLKSIRLDCAGDEVEFFERLMELKSTPSENGTTQSVVFCPHLTTLMVSGIEGPTMIKFVEARKKGGAPLVKLSLSELDNVDDKEEEWLKAHLEELDFFEPSDSEEELDVDDEDVNELLHTGVVMGLH